MGLLACPDSLEGFLDLAHSFDAFLFDFDGTLADTMPTHFLAWKAALGPHAHLFPEDLFYSWGGRSSADIVSSLNQLIIDANDHIDPVDLAHRKEAIFDEMVVKEGGLKPLTPVLLLARRAFELGKPIAIASGGHRVSVLRGIEMIGAPDLFPPEVVVAMEDVPRSKPHPDPFLEAAKRCKVAPDQCLALDDAPPGVQSAVSANAKAVIHVSRAQMKEMSEVK